MQAYRDFLNSNWDLIENVEEQIDWDEDVDLTTDWMQANLEILVVRTVAGPSACLQLWAGRAEKPSILHPNSSPTHQIAAVINADSNQTYLFEGLCTRINSDCKTKHPNWPQELWESVQNNPDSSWYGIYPPFDYAILRGANHPKSEPTYCHIDHVEFFLQSLTQV